MTTATGHTVSVPLGVGDLAPPFTLAAESGDTLRSADYAGRKLVVYFYPKDDTSGCTREATDFTGLVAKFAAADTVVVGISKDSVANHAKFRAKHALDVRLGADVDGITVEAYGCWVEKNMYGRKYMGIERASFLIGRDGRVAAIWRKVKVPGHAAAVLKATQDIA